MVHKTEFVSSMQGCFRPGPHDQDILEHDTALTRSCSRTAPGDAFTADQGDQVCHNTTVTVSQQTSASRTVQTSAWVLPGLPDKSSGFLSTQESLSTSLSAGERAGLAPQAVCKPRG